MENKFTPIADSLLEYFRDKDISLLGIVLLSHIQRREQGEYGACTESAGSLAASFHVSVNTVLREAEKLHQQGYISKSVVRGKGWELKTIPMDSTPIQSAPTESAPTQVGQCTHTECTPHPHRVHSAPTVGDKETIKRQRKKQKKNIGGKSPAPSPFSALPDSNLKEALMDYAEVRKEMKSPIRTPRQEKILLSALEKHAPGDVSKQIAIIEQSIGAGWKSFYALKIDEQKPVKERGSNTWEQRKLIQ